MFKTGEYRLCQGTEAECSKGNGPGGDYLYFEKNGVGRHTFKYEEDYFLWERKESTLVVKPEDESAEPYQLEMRSSTLLYDPKEELFYVLEEDEDAVFRPGMYVECMGTGPEACEKTLEDISKASGDELEIPGASLVLLDEYSQSCPKKGTECLDITWKRVDDTHLTVSGGSKLRLVIERNRLIDAAGGKTYIRLFSDRVLRSIN